jgi:prolyl-tRNA synthetase
MLWSKLFIPTLREVPAEAEVASHQLLYAPDTSASFQPVSTVSCFWRSGRC